MAAGLASDKPKNTKNVLDQSIQWLDFRERLRGLEENQGAIREWVDAFLGFQSSMSGPAHSCAPVTRKMAAAPIRTTPSALAMRMMETIMRHRCSRFSQPFTFLLWPCSLGMEARGPTYDDNNPFHMLDQLPKDL